MKKNHKKAITLVELVIVITILSILGLISYLGFMSYAKDSRDSARVADINAIKRSLGILKAEGGQYPSPSNAVSITLSGTLLWEQGTFGDSALRAVKIMSKVPTDPLTGNEYTFSTLGDKSFYEIGAIYEGDLGQ